MKWVISVIGLCAIAFGSWWGWFGWTIVQVERGWSALIAGSVIASSGLVLLGLAAVAARIDALKKVMTDLAVAAAPVQDRRHPEQLPRPSVPASVSKPVDSGNDVPAGLPTAARPPIARTQVRAASASADVLAQRSVNTAAAGTLAVATSAAVAMTALGATKDDSGASRSSATEETVRNAIEDESHAAISAALFPDEAVADGANAEFQIANDSARGDNAKLPLATSESLIDDTSPSAVAGAGAIDQGSFDDFEDPQLMLPPPRRVVNTDVEWPAPPAEVAPKAVNVAQDETQPVIAGLDGDAEKLVGTSSSTIESNPAGTSFRDSSANVAAALAGLAAVNRASDTSPKVADDLPTISPVDEVDAWADDQQWAGEDISPDDTSQVSNDLQATSDWEVEAPEPNLDQADQFEHDASVAEVDDAVVEAPIGVETEAAFPFDDAGSTEEIAQVAHHPSTPVEEPATNPKSLQRREFGTNPPAEIAQDTHAAAANLPAGAESDWLDDLYQDEQAIKPYRASYGSAEAPSNLSTTARSNATAADDWSDWKSENVPGSGANQSIADPQAATHPAGNEHVEGNKVGTELQFSAGAEGVVQGSVPFAQQVASPVVEGTSEQAEKPPLLRSYESQGITYFLYTDGSIEAQTPGGMLRFSSLQELRGYIEKRTR